MRIVSLIGSGKKLSGTYRPPSDKSITHRSVFFASLSKDSSVINTPLLSGDCLSTILCFRNLGVPIKIHKDKITVPKDSCGGSSIYRFLRAPKKPLYCGNSGTTMRLLSGLLAGQPFNSSLTGDSSLSRRPMKRVMDPLRRMGAVIEARKNNFAPLKIRGNPDLRGMAWKSPVASAQVKSCVLLAGLHAMGRTSFTEPVRSRDHTERMLKSMGAKISFESHGARANGNTCSISGGVSLKGLKLAVPSDFSSAAFFIGASLMLPGSKITACDVLLNPTRTGLLNLLKTMGAKIRILNRKTTCGEQVGDIQSSFSSLRGGTVQSWGIPSMIDELPILSVIGTQARGATIVKGAEELRLKESDRIHAMVSELKKMGAKIEEKRDGFVVHGPVKLKAAKVDSHGDHRVAMSLAMAGLIASGTTEIHGFDCVKISFPGFLDYLKRLTV